MSAPSPPPTDGVARTGVSSRIVVLVTTMLRLQATRNRVVAIVVILALLGLGLGVGGASAGQVQLLLREGGVALLIPFVTLSFATGGLGDLHEEGTLVYLWARPVPRWAIAVAATVASVVLAAVPNVLAMVSVAALGGQPGLVPAAAAAAFGGTLAYAAVFVALGLRTRRALMWGLGYVLLFEGFLARFSDTFAALSIRRSIEAILRRLGDLGSSGPSLGRATITLVVATVLGTVATTWFLTRRDVP